MSIFDRFIKIVRAEIDFSSKEKKSFTRERVNDSFERNDENEDEEHVDSIEAGYYANLELAVGSNFEEIKRAYREQLRKYHPDKFQGDKKEEFAEEITKKINEAYHYFEEKHHKEK